MSVRRIGGVVCVLVMVFAGGCGGGEGNESASAPAATGFAPAAAAAAAEEQERRAGLVGTKSAARTDRDSLRGNAAPVVSQVEIVRTEEDSRRASDVETWRAVAQGRDVDGDSVRFSYQWIVNGERTDEEDEFFPVGRLVRGDRLQVEATADDGRATSAPLRSGTIVIGNRAPQIVSNPPRPDALGRFRYQLRVHDPDGDTNFVYQLDQAPDGMKIDSKTGLVVWQPTVEQAGSHEISVAVSDEDGAQAIQSFRLALIKRVEGSPPAAAR